MNQNFQPYGRVSGGVRERERSARRAGWDLRFAVLMVFPAICLLVVLYEFLYLQQVTSSANEVQEAKLQHTPEQNVRLRVETTASGTLQAELSPSPSSSPSPSPEPTNSIIKERRTMILIANYRDSKRCSETLKSIFENAVEPDLVKISIFDQIYIEKGEKTCVDTYCELMGAACRRSQVVNTIIDAEKALGPTYARYQTENAITDEDFCMAIDSHLIFVPKWDEVVQSQWDSLNSEYAIITVYPKSIEHMHNEDSLTRLQLMCVARIETEDKDAMIQYGAPIWLLKKDTPKPRLQSQLAGGFNFGNCKQAKEIRNDPYTPFLFHGEEYSRAARLWTSGYDFYTPSEDVVYHWYEKRNVVWERDWGTRYFIMQTSKRRIRYNLGLPVTMEDFDRTELDKFTLGNKRTWEQWVKFSGIDPLAQFIDPEAEQFKNCGELELVPFN